MKEESKRWIRPSEKMPVEGEDVEVLIKSLAPDAKTHKDVIRKIIVDYATSDFCGRMRFMCEYRFGIYVVAWRNISS